MNNFPGGSRRNRLICESSTVDSLCERFKSSRSYLNHERIIIKRDLYLDPRFRLQKEEESKVSRCKTVAINRRYVIVWTSLIKKKCRDELYDSILPLIRSRKRDRSCRGNDFSHLIFVSWEESFVTRGVSFATRLLNEFSK